MVHQIVTNTLTQISTRSQPYQKSNSLFIHNVSTYMFNIFMRTNARKKALKAETVFSCG
jgi:hypothetical protein